MIKLLGKIPNDVTLACSGGDDSMAALAFLLMGRKRVRVAYFDHGTQHGQEALGFIRSHVEDELGVPTTYRTITKERPPGASKEEHWRDERYKWLHSLDGPVITTHHLDDCVETYIFTSLNGVGRPIPYSRGNVIRPFLLARKHELHEFLLAHRMKNWPKGLPDIRSIQDPSNEDISYMRNLIRKEVVPSCLKVNPGLHRVVARKVQAQFDEMGDL